MSILLAATRRGVSRVGDGDSLRTLDGPDVRCLAVVGSTAFAGTDGDGVFRTDDGGLTWTSIGLEEHRIRSLAAGDDVVYAGTREPRVHVLHDGEPWRALAPFPRARSWWWMQPAERPFRPSYVSALALAGTNLVAGIEACAVLLSTDGGSSWSAHRRRALRDCHRIVRFRHMLYEAGSGGLAVSADGGSTWGRRRAGLDRRYGWDVAVAPETVYLAAAPYRSAHTGAARARIFRARGSGPFEPCTDELGSLPRLAVTADGTVYAAQGGGALLRSCDEGGSWQAVAASLEGPARALACVPR